MCAGGCGQRRRRENKMKREEGKKKRGGKKKVHTCGWGVVSSRCTRASSSANATELTT
jgi:hypothetical protein